MLVCTSSWSVYSALISSRTDANVSLHLPSFCWVLAIYPADSREDGDGQIKLTLDRGGRSVHSATKTMNRARSDAQRKFAGP